MLTRTNAAEKRKSLRTALGSGRIQRFPGAFSPLVSLAVERHGFEGVYVSGAALSADLGLPDIGLTNISEVSARGGAIADSTGIPTIIDADTGFGEAANVARSIRTLENAGLAGCHLEDQVNPKRCGHLEGKELVSCEEMARKIRAAVSARRDPNFLIIARTDARACEGMDATLTRAKSYVEAGADMIFPEALQSEAEFAAFRQAMSVPLLANMTEFGKSPLLSAAQLEKLGFQIVIFPVTTLRLAMKAVDDGLAAIAAQGTQTQIVDKMQTRAELYKLIGYEHYTAMDQKIAGYAARDSSGDRH